MWLNDKKPEISNEETFDALIKNTKHFVDEQITKEDEMTANKKISTFSIFEEIIITSQILNHLNFENLFTQRDISLVYVSSLF